MLIGKCWAKLLSAHFEAAAAKKKSQLKGEGGSFLATKMHPSLAAEVCVSQNTSRMHRVGFGWGWGGRRLKALDLSFLSQLAFSSDPWREERGPCLIRRDDNLHPSQ